MTEFEIGLCIIGGTFLVSGIWTIALCLGKLISIAEKAEAQPKEKA